MKEISKMSKNEVLKKIGDVTASLNMLRYEQEYQEGYYSGDVPELITNSYCYSEKIFNDELDQLHERLAKIEFAEQKDCENDYNHFRKN